MSLFQSILRKQIRKLPKILKSDSVKIIHYFSLLFIRVLNPHWLDGRVRAEVQGSADALLPHGGLHRRGPLPRPEPPAALRSCTAGRAGL